MFFFFKQKTAYEVRISDWSSDVCSSDLAWPPFAGTWQEIAEAEARALTELEARTDSMENLAEAEQANDDRDDINASKQLGRAEGQARLAGNNIRSDCADRKSTSLNSSH